MADFKFDFIAPTIDHGTIIHFKLPKSMIPSLEVYGWENCELKEKWTSNKTVISTGCKLKGTYIEVTIDPTKPMILKERYSLLLTNVHTPDYTGEGKDGDYSVSLMNKAGLVSYQSDPSFFKFDYPKFKNQATYRYLYFSDIYGNKTESIDIPVGGYSDFMCIDSGETWVDTFSFKIKAKSKVKFLLKSLVTTTIGTNRTCFKLGIPSTYTIGLYYDLIMNTT